MTDVAPTSGVILSAVEKSFADVAAVRSFDLDIGAGELVVLLGPSGCGKTTVLRMIAGLEEPDRGEIKIGERVVNDIEPAQRDIAMVFQNYALYPHMTVHQNLGFGLKMRKLAQPEIDAKVARAAAVLGLQDLLTRKPAQLSGGQRQRVALGRALVREPAVFLFDEPLSNLDARLRLEMRSEIAQLHQRLGTTMVYVTHDQVEAMTLGERIAIMKDGELQQYAPPLEVYRYPTNLFVATFVGSPPINTVQGTLTSEGTRSVFAAPGIQLELTPRSHGGPVTLGARPEALAIVSAVQDVDFTAEIARLELLGNELLVHLNGPADSRWIARVDPEHRCAPREQVGIKLDRARVHLFSQSDNARLEPTRLERSD
jgi:multiple sugar transport system ATP-binding protein